MKTIINLFFAAILFLCFIGITNGQEKPDTKNRTPEGFKGKIAKSYEDSEEYWEKKKPPPKDAPNIDKLADNGSRYNNFHTIALCSPSRATLMEILI